jgi:hypothetical protein
MLAVMFLLSATPTAAASFVMVQAVNGNSALAASIIVWTTCACVLSLTVWLVILRSLQVI